MLSPRPLHASLAAALLMGGCSCQPSRDPTDASTGSTDAGDDEPDAGPVEGCANGTLPAWAEVTGPGAWSLAFAHHALRIAVFDDGLARLHYVGSRAHTDRSFAVESLPTADGAARAGSRGEDFELCTAALTIRVAPSGLLEIRSADGTVLVGDPIDGGWFEDATRQGVVRRTQDGERLLGLGEKSGTLDRRGREFTLRNTDPYSESAGGWPPGTDPLYQAIPLLIGQRDALAYGVFTDVAYKQRYDLGKTDPARLRIEAEGGAFVQWVIPGPTLADVLRRYTALTGRPPLPPKWALGLHQSRWGYEPAQQVLDVAAELRRRRIPADALWLDIQHLDGFRSFTWDPGKFADPAGLVRALADQGFRTTLIVDPGLKVDPAWDVYQAGVAGSHFLKRDDGAPFVGTVWPGDASFPDFTRAATRAWWGTLVARPVRLGVRGVWIDMNEPATFDAATGGSVPDSIAADGDGIATTMAEAHNVYALHEARATRDGMLAAAPNVRPFVLTRAGYAGIQRFAAVWTGDAPSGWPTLRDTLPVMLGMGLSGVSFIGSDVGGYSGRATPELYARWIELGSISPFFRIHTMQGGALQEPWRFGQEVEDLSREVVENRYALLPYLYSLFHEASRSGAPVLRPLAWDFPAGPLASIDDEALVGPWLLYAPVLEEGAKTRTIRLPPGRWFEARSGAIHDGPATLEHTVTLAALPTFVREGALVPRIEPMPHTGHHAAPVLFLDAYPAASESSFTLYEDDGESLAYESGGSSSVTWTLQRLATGAVLKAHGRTGTFTPPARQLAVRVRRVDTAATAALLDGTPLVQRGSRAEAMASGGWWRDAQDRSLLVVFPDRPQFRLELAYDPAITELTPTVEVPFVVEVPAGTPTDKPVTLATSANAWVHAPLTWTSATTAEGRATVPRGEWFFFKFARGGWDTVEKWPGCVEATNRYAFGQADPVRHETVWAWADRCP